MRCKKRIIPFISFLLICVAIRAQEEEGPWQGSYFPVIQLDSVNVVASKQLTIDDLKKIITKDSSLIKSFWDMRNYDFASNNHIEAYDKKGRLAGTEKRNMEHFFIDSLLYHKTVSRDVQGKLYEKDGEAIYSALTLFNNVMKDDTFWINQVERSKAAHQEMLDEMSEKKLKRYEKKRAKQKEKFMGFPINRDSSDSEESRFKDLPFLDNKLAIFEPEMEKHYFFKMREGFSKYGDESYIFLAIPKKPKRDATVIKRLEVCIKKEDLSIIGYSLDALYNSILWDCDLKLDTNLKFVKEHYVPIDLLLDCEFDVILMPQERFVWKANAHDFKMNKDGLKGLSN